jgi:ubiquinol-cytochrome c reductase cytochrome b subunit
MAAIRWTKDSILGFINSHIVDYPTPVNLNYFWSFGAILTFTLLGLIATGVVLGMHYKPSVAEAFDSVEHIMRDVNGGWLIRYAHMNLASFFFIAVYIHMFRGLYFGSYKEPRQLMWIFGIIIYFLMMATAFLGYVLPWGQMSYWGATVITSLFGAIPLVGDSIVTLLWGDYSVGDAFLNRAFILHWLIAFIIVLVVVFHVIALHMTGSNNPTGVEPKDTRDTVSFHPYVTMKDMYAFLVFLLVFMAFLLYMPNILGHPDNYIEANPMVTPAHIVPEWYFLPWYAVLRAIPDKLGGVIAMVSAIGIMALLPWLDTSKIRSSIYRPIWKQFTWFLVGDFFLLMYCGAMPAEGLWILLSRIGTAYWFAYFIILAPLVGWVEKPQLIPDAIHLTDKKK